MAFTVDIKGNASHLDKTLKNVKTSIGSIGSVAGSVTTALAGMGAAGAAALGAFAISSSQKASAIESLTMQFETLLGSAYTLSLHDALPIIGRASCRERVYFYILERFVQVRCVAFDIYCECHNIPSISKSMSICACSLISASLSASDFVIFSVVIFLRKTRAPFRKRIA